MNEHLYPSQLPITISIGTVSVNSGVYIAKENFVCGISRHSKSNNGSGSMGSHNTVIGNVNLVYDPDFIDAPIDDRDVNIHVQNQLSRTPPVTNVGFDTINVATMSQNSGVFVGDVKISGLDSHSKQNVAEGSTYGSHNVSMQNFNFTDDPDTIDAPIYDQDVKFLIR